MRIIQIIRKIYLHQREELKLMRLFLNRGKISRMEATFPDLYKLIVHVKEADLSHITNDVLTDAYHHLNSKELESIFILLTNNSNIDQEQIESIENLRDHYDNLYLTLINDDTKQDDENAHKYNKMTCFLSAAHFFLTQREKHGLYEALYDVLFAFDDPDIWCQNIMKSINAKNHDK